VTHPRIQILSQAQHEINEAFDWYFKRSARAAAAFLAEVDAAFQQIAAHPRLYPVYTHSTRRRVLTRVPYSAIFLETNELILIVALAHAKRRAGYWIGRV
jgi:toxin ParE2